MVVKSKKKWDDEENIKNIPNALTLFRFLATFVIAYLILEDFDPKTILIFYIVAASTDKLDGSWARLTSSVTKFGANFDIIADRAFFGVTILCLIVYYAFIDMGNQLLVLSLFLIMTREMITLPAILIMGMRIPETKTVGKMTTFLQAVTIGMIILQWKISFYFSILTGIVGIFSGVTYFNDILSKK